MNIGKQQCIDGDTLLIGDALLSDDLKTAFNEISRCRFDDVDDIYCTRNILEDDVWDNMSEQDQQMLYCIVANVYQVFISNMDEFLQEVCDDDIALQFDKRTNTVIPTATETKSLEHTLLKCAA
jgi:hypothetical protein